MTTTTSATATVYTAASEKAVLRTAKQRHYCWSWAEKSRAPGEGWDGNPPCTRMIEVGEQYLLDTIYPGHDSGYADGGWDRRGNPTPPRPVSSRFCLLCAGRWVNLKPALAVLLPARGEQS